uniref:non-specific serine/threonine protein kinase n=1 Tax=Callithrix jacchus TaxID=9483 RepID=A0A8I3WL81_CALJA|nr:sperm motility kinase-like [Callithrix jacchus]
MKQGLASTSPALRPLHYQILNFIGRGAFGEVTLARHLKTSTRVAVAVKTIDRTGFLSSHREMTVLQSVHHRNIIKLYHIISSKEACQLVLEYAAGGSLSNWLEQNIMTEEEARGKFQQMLSAVRYLHRRSIAHRDLKPDNMLLDIKGNIKIADFGSATSYHEGQRLTIAHGTLAYMAPELFGAQGYECPAMDIWSLGVTLFQMVSNNLPFSAVSRTQLKRLILSGQYASPQYFSEGLKRLIKNLLTPDPNEWPTADKVMGESWVNNGLHRKSDPQHAPTASLTIERNCEDLENLARQALQCDRVASSIVSAIGSGGALETLAEEAPQRDLVSAASTKCSTGRENLETLAQPALPHNLTAASTQITTQSTVAPQPVHEGSVLQAGQPEAVLARPTRGWSCRRAARRCIAIIRRCCWPVPIQEAE